MTQRFFVGDTWHTRDGKYLAEITSLTGRENMVFPITGKVLTHGPGDVDTWAQWTWTWDGSYLSNEEHPLDLVRKFVPVELATSSEGYRLLDLR